MFNPLPKGLRIWKSKIQGYGLFTTHFIEKDTNLGLSHIKIDEEMFHYDDDHLHGEIIRTPLGGFVNHSEDPNCIKIQEDNRYYLTTIKDVAEGEELTVKYTFYKVKNDRCI